MLLPTVRGALTFKVVPVTLPLAITSDPVNVAGLLKVTLSLYSWVPVVLTVISLLVKVKGFSAVNVPAVTLPCMVAVVVGLIVTSPALPPEAEALRLPVRISVAEFSSISPAVAPDRVAGKADVFNSPVEMPDCVLFSLIFLLKPVVFRLFV